MSKSYYATNNYDLALYFNIKHYETEATRDYTYDYRLDVD